MSASPSFVTLRNVTKRMFSAKAAADIIQKAPVLGYQQTKLPNGMTLCSIETGSPITRIAISAKAGSRYETSENRGAAHVLRVMTGGRTDDTTAVTITRHLQQLGASLTCSVTRDSVSYSLLCLRDHVPEAVQYLKECALHPLFRQWELNDNVWRLSSDIAALKKNPSAMLVESLHEAAYRSGLSNSLYCPEYMVGHHSSEMMTNYLKEHFTNERLAVMSIGMGQDELAEVAKSLTAGSGAGASASSAYRGGEVRKDTGGPLSHAAVAVEIPGNITLKEALALDVLGSILGNGARTKYGSSLGSRFGAALAKAVPDHHCEASTFLMPYEGSGLFGFSATAPSEVAAKAIKTVADEMKILIGGKLTDADVAAGKAKLKNHYLGGTLAETFEDLKMYIQSTKDEFHSPTENFTQLETVTAQDVSAVARKVLGGKPCMAAVGNTANVPYLDQL